MPTAVVSGRVDEETYRRANTIIQLEGKTPAEVIKGVWTTIAATGHVPPTHEEALERQAQGERFRQFMEVVQSLPPVPPELATMTRDEYRDLLGDRDV